MRDFSIVSEGGHYVVYIDGAFYCSADTFEEAYKEAESYIYLYDEE